MLLRVNLLVLINGIVLKQAWSLVSKLVKDVINKSFLNEFQG